ncbi:hypothetical protein G6F37_011405 [Rhizopus arrhizus]|nr:hypothetical protein G6F37_011405 [Rhizopus arrhizus]
MSVSNSDYNNNNNVDSNATFALTEEQKETLYQQYVAGGWTKTPVINKSFMADLKRYQVEAKQVISNRYDDSGKLRIVGRSAAEIFESLGAYMESGDQETFLQVMEKVRWLSIFSFATSQEIDREAKEFTLTALRLPQHAKHLEDQHAEDDTKSVVGVVYQRVKLDRDFSNRDTLHSALSQFSNLTELEVHVNLTKAKKNHLDSKKDLNAIKIDVDNNSEHTATITTFNEFVKASVTKYESGDALDSDLNALALHNMILIQPGDNNYGIKANDWDRFKDFAQGDSVPTPTQLNVVEKDVC